MKINVCVLSDTHCPSVHDLPRKLIKALFKADLIIHAGDAQYVSFLRELGAFATVITVKGNHDKDWKTYPLRHKELINIAGHRIGLTHGHIGEGKTFERALGMFDERLDLIIYGHNHRDTYQRQYGKLMMLNPGSPTDTRQEYSSFATLKIGKKIDAKIHRWKNF